MSNDLKVTLSLFSTFPSLSLLTLPLSHFVTAPPGSITPTAPSPGALSAYRPPKTFFAKMSNDL